MILTPRDWQAIAQREASELLGTSEGAARLAEAKRYGALADVIEQQHRDIERQRDELNALDKALRCEGWPLEARVKHAESISNCVWRAAYRKRCADWLFERSEAWGKQVDGSDGNDEWSRAGIAALKSALWELANEPPDSLK